MLFRLQNSATRNFGNNSISRTGNFKERWIGCYCLDSDTICPDYGRGSCYVDEAQVTPSLGSLVVVAIRWRNSKSKLHSGDKQIVPACGLRGNSNEYGARYDLNID